MRPNTLLACLVLVAGCATPKPTPIGTWEGEDKGNVVRFVLEAEGSCNVVMTGSVRGYCKYVQKGNAISVTDVWNPGASATVQPPVIELTFEPAADAITVEGPKPMRLKRVGK